MCCWFACLLAGRGCFVGCLVGFVAAAALLVFAVFVIAAAAVDVV